MTISTKSQLKLINRIKSLLHKDDTFQQMCEEYDLSTSIIDNIPIMFAPLDVSARTQSGVMTLNKKLLDGKIGDIAMYIIHEARHYLDQCYGDTATTGSDYGDYLENPFEHSAFQTQIQFIDDQFGSQEANDYTEQLLDHHDKAGKERKELKEELMEKANAND